MAPHYRRTTVLLLAALASQPVDAADLNGKTVAAFDRYVRATEERLDSPDAPFLWVDTLPAEDRKTNVFGWIITLIPRVGIIRPF